MAKSGKKAPAARTTSKTSEKAARRQKTEKALAGADPAAHVRPAAESTSGSADVLDRLWAIIDSRREADPALSHSARLLDRTGDEITLDEVERIQI
jgi:phosphoribosyl-ATP pyrophosphohydrolase